MVANASACAAWRAGKGYISTHQLDRHQACSDLRFVSRIADRSSLLNQLLVDFDKLRQPAGPERDVGAEVASLDLARQVTRPAAGIDGPLEDAGEILQRALAAPVVDPRFGEPCGGHERQQTSFIGEHRGLSGGPAGCAVVALHHQQLGFEQSNSSLRLETAILW